MQLLKELTEANGVSGFEKEVREVMKRELSKENVEIQTDGLGGILGLKKGQVTGRVFYWPDTWMKSALW